MTAMGTFGCLVHTGAQSREARLWSAAFRKARFVLYLTWQWCAFLSGARPPGPPIRSHYWQFACVVRRSGLSPVTVISSAGANYTRRLHNAFKCHLWLNARRMKRAVRCRAVLSNHLFLSLPLPLCVCVCVRVRVQVREMRPQFHAGHAAQQTPADAQRVQTHQREQRINRGGLTDWPAAKIMIKCHGHLSKTKDFLRETLNHARKTKSSNKISEMLRDIDPGTGWGWGTLFINELVNEDVFRRAEK